VFIAKSLECGYCAAQRSALGAAQGLVEQAFDEVIDFRRSQLLTARDKAALRWAATSPSPSWSSSATSSA
jgi:alkylhydroperoxidase family enzyme